jgi:hypothetical protein
MSKLPDLQNTDLSRFRLPRQIADLPKLWPISGDVVESSDQDNDSQGLPLSLVLKPEILVQGY